MKRCYPDWNCQLGDNYFTAAEDVADLLYLLPNAVTTLRNAETSMVAWTFEMFAKVLPDVPDTLAAALCAPFPSSATQRTLVEFSTAVA